MARLTDLPQEFLHRNFSQAHYYQGRQLFEWYGLSTTWTLRQLSMCE